MKFRCHQLILGHGFCHCSLACNGNWHALRSAARALASCCLPLDGKHYEMPQQRHKTRLPAAGRHFAISALVVGANASLCQTPYLLHPATAARVEAVYSWLEPAVAPLEPLLWLVGIDAGHPRRRCYCGRFG